MHQFMTPDLDCDESRFLIDTDESFNELPYSVCLTFRRRISLPISGEDVKPRENGHHQAIKSFFKSVQMPIQVRQDQLFINLRRFTFDSIDSVDLLFLDLVEVKHWFGVDC